MKHRTNLYLQLNYSGRIQKIFRKWVMVMVIVMLFSTSRNCTKFALFKDADDSTWNRNGS